LIQLLSSAYGAVVALRRAWYTREPSRQHRLTRPVVSIGNLRVGGSGKTPMVEYIARLLLEHGQRPAILTRGYGRRDPRDGVTVVSDGTRVLAGLDDAGDEPLMLARALPGVRVLVGSDRYLSGLFAERRLDATVHLLDDGFQHLELARDVDLLLVAEDDLQDQPLPAGRLRERISAAKAADAALITAGYDTAAERIGRAFGVSRSSASPARSARRDTSPARAIRWSSLQALASSSSPASPGPTVSSPTSRQLAGKCPASSSSAITISSPRAT
jgi:tetraacyldisaccharide 4'-kinase